MSTCFRVSRLVLSTKDRSVVEEKHEHVSIPVHVLFGSSQELFGFVAQHIKKFVHTEVQDFNLQRELRFRYSFSAHSYYSSGSRTTGSTVVSELKKALQGADLDIYVPTTYQAQEVSSQLGKRVESVAPATGPTRFNIVNKRLAWFWTSEASGWITISAYFAMFVALYEYVCQKLGEDESDETITLLKKIWARIEEKEEGQGRVDENDELGHKLYLSPG